MDRIDGWIVLLMKAVEKASELEQEVFMADDNTGHWNIYQADEEGHTPSILLAVDGSGGLRLVDNSIAGPTDEPWRR